MEKCLTVPPPPPHQLDLLLEELSVSVERELPSGETAPVIAMAMGKYGTKALWLSMQEWSGKVCTYVVLCVFVVLLLCTSSSRNGILKGTKAQSDFLSWT